MKTTTNLTLLALSLVLAGCSTTTTSVNPTFMTTGQMADHCRGEAAGKFNTRPQYVTVAAALPRVGGGYVVTGSVDMGASGNPPFECQFGPAGNFVAYRAL